MRGSDRPHTGSVTRLGCQAAHDVPKGPFRDRAPIGLDKLKGHIADDAAPRRDCGAP